MKIAQLILAGAAIVAMLGLPAAAADADEESGPPTFFGIPITVDEGAAQQRRERARNADADADNTPEPAPPREAPTREPDASSDSEMTPEPQEENPPVAEADPSLVAWLATASSVPDPLYLPDPFIVRYQASPVAVVQLGSALRRAFKCEMCSGATEVTRRRRVGSENAGGLRRDVYVTETITCSRCEGDGYGTGRALNRLLANLTIKFSAMHHQDARHPEALTRTHGVLLALLEHDARALAGRLNSVNIDILQRAIEVDHVFGAPFIAVGEVVAVGALPQTESLVVAMEMDESLVIVSDLKFANEPVVGERMLFGGLVANFVQHSSAAIPVVQHGYLIASGSGPESIVDPEGFVKRGVWDIEAFRQREASRRLEDDDEGGEADEPEIIVRSIDDFAQIVPREFQQGDTHDEALRLMTDWAGDALEDTRVFTQGGEILDWSEGMTIDDGEAHEIGRFRSRRVFQGNGWDLVIVGTLRRPLDQARQMGQDIANGGDWSGSIRSVEYRQARRDRAASIVIEVRSLRMP